MPEMRVDMSDVHLMKPAIEHAIATIVGILSETQAASGMSRSDCENLKKAFRELVAATQQS